MRPILAIVLAVSLAACKGKEKTGPTPALDAAPVAVTADAPPPPPADALMPGPAEATRTLTAILEKVAAETGVATMHGCAEGADRVAELFEGAVESAGLLRSWMVDEKLRGELAAVVKDRSDPALAAVLAKIDLDVKGCKGAEAATKKGLDALLTPP